MQSDAQKVNIKDIKEHKYRNTIVHVKCRRKKTAVL